MTSRPPTIGVYVHRSPARSQGPAAPVAVLVHGSMDRSAAFARWRPHLPAFNLISLDRRGYGRSRDAVPPAVSLDDHATDVVALAAETPGTKVVLVGHSYGGCVVLRAAELAPSLVRAVVVFESPLPWLDGWPTTSGGGMSLGAPTPQLAGEGFMRRMIGDERWEALPEKAKTDRRAEGAALQNDMRSIRPTVGQRLPLDLAGWRRLAIPLVVARGELSSAHLRWGAAALAQMAGAELHDIAGASHGAHVSHPAAMAALVVRAMEIGGD